MNYLQGIIIPAIKIIVYVIMFFFIVGGIYYVFYRWWNRSLRFFIKYTLLRSHYDEDVVKLCAEYVNLNKSSSDIKKLCLMSGFPMNEAREITWIFNKIEKELKGGAVNHGRKYEADFRKTKIAKLPTTADAIRNALEGKDS